VRRSRATTQRAVGGAAVVIAALLLACAVAFAAKPVKGATYSGAWKNKVGQRFGISFTVLRNGNRVKAVKLPAGAPVFCNGGGFGKPVRQVKSVKISSSGAFAVTLRIYSAPTKQTQGTVLVKGTFLANRRAKGTVTTKFKNAKVCNGTVKYTAAVG
jgi:hypothetical protein